MGLFDSLGDISMGYLARQREVQDKEASEAFEQNKSSIGNLSKFWTAAMEGSRNDPEVQQALLSRIAEISQLDPRKVKSKDIARLADASILWQGVKRSPESMQPREQQMSAQIQPQQSGPIIPMPQPTGLDFGKDNGPRTESTTPLPGQRSGMQMAPPLPTNLDQSTIPLPAPPTEYMSVYPSQQEIESQAYATEEAKAQNALKRELEKQRALKQLNQEFAQAEAPGDRYSSFGGDGLYDKITGEIVRQPSADAAKAANYPYRDTIRGDKKIRQYYEGHPGNVVFEADMGLASQDSSGQEPGSYLPLTNNYGQVIGAWNPKSRTSVPIPEGFTGARRSGVPVGEMEERASLDTMLEDMNTLENLANTNKAAIGPIAGRVQAFKRETVGATPEVNELFRISDNISDMLLRARSGASINEAEYGRLRGLTPNPRGPVDRFFSDLKGFKSEVQRIMQRRTGSNSPNIAPPTPPGSSPATSSGNRTRIKVQP